MAPHSVKAAIFDWSGTVLDFGSVAPMAAFVDVFAEFGVEITVADARKPMGLSKRDHVAALGAMPHIAEAWQHAHGGAPFDVAAADGLYAVYVDRVCEIVANHSTLIPGAYDTIAALRERGIKIGSTTGYTRRMMSHVLPRAAEQGYAPDNLVCADDVPAGRPSPMMMYKCFLDLAVWPAGHTVKVDDTAPGITAGRAAGAWTIGLALSGNEAGLTLADFEASNEAEIAPLRDRSTKILRDAGADFVIDTIADLLPVIDEIDARIAAGEVPPAP